MSVHRPVQGLRRGLVVVGGLATTGLSLVLALAQASSSNLTAPGMSALLATTSYGLLLIPANRARWSTWSVVVCGGAMVFLCLAGLADGWLNHYVRLAVLTYLLPIAGLTWLLAIVDLLGARKAQKGTGADRLRES